MKKVFTFLFAIGVIFGFTQNLYSQNGYGAAVTIGEEEGVPGTTVLVPVTADFDMGNDVYSFEFHLEFDTDVIKFSSITNINSAFENELELAAEDFGSGVYLKIWWTETTPDAPNFTGKLFDIAFDYSGLESDIIFHEKNGVGFSEVGGEVASDKGDGLSIANQINTNFTDGRVYEAESTAVPFSNWSILLGAILMLGFVVVRFVRI